MIYLEFADRFGWTPDQVDALPLQLYVDFLTMMNTQAQYADFERRSAQHNGR